MTNYALLLGLEKPIHTRIPKRLLTIHIEAEDEKPITASLPQFKTLDMSRSCEAIYQHMLEHGPMSKAEISETLGITNKSLTDRLGLMRKSEMVEFVKHGMSGLWQAIPRETHETFSVDEVFQQDLKSVGDIINNHGRITATGIKDESGLSMARVVACTKELASRGAIRKAKHFWVVD